MKYIDKNTILRHIVKKYDFWFTKERQIPIGLLQRHIGDYVLIANQYQTNLYCACKLKSVEYKDGCASLLIEDRIELKNTQGETLMYKKYKDGWYSSYRGNYTKFYRIDALTYRYIKQTNRLIKKRGFSYGKVYELYKGNQRLKRKIRVR